MKIDGIEDEQAAHTHSIAIIGMAGRFPGAPDLAGNAGRAARVAELDAAISTYTATRNISDVLAAMETARAAAGGCMDRCTCAHVFGISTGAWRDASTSIATPGSRTVHRTGSIALRQSPTSGSARSSTTHIEWPRDMLSA